MAFNFGAGIAKAGEAIADTAGKYTLEAQRADLARQGIILADELAGKREGAQREFLSSERVEGQKFQSGEKVLDRTHGEKLAQLQADTAIRTAGISAGASKYAADLGASERQKDRDQNAPLVAQQTIAGHIKNQSEQGVLDARKELQTARESGDPLKIKAAQQKEYDATYSSQQQVQQVSLFQAQAKLLEAAVTATQTRLVALQDPVKQMTPEGKALATTLEAQLKRQYAEFQAAMRTADEALKNLPAYNPPGVGAGSGVIEYDAAGKRVGAPATPAVTGNALPLPKKPVGLIDSPSVVSP